METTQSELNIPAAAESEEPVMENVTRMNRERYFEAATVRGKSWRSRIFTVLGAISAVTGLILGNPTLVVVALAVTLLSMFSHLIVAWRDFGKLKRFHPSGEWDKTIRFYADRIETDSGVGAVSVASYRDIKREYETEHMFVLDFGGKAPATTLHKDSFTSGSFAALRDFLVERQRAEYDDAK